MGQTNNLSQVNIQAVIDSSRLLNAYNQYLNGGLTIYLEGHFQGDERHRCSIELRIHTTKGWPMFPRFTKHALNSVRFELNPNRGTEQVAGVTPCADTHCSTTASITAPLSSSLTTTTTTISTRLAVAHSRLDPPSLGFALFALVDGSISNVCATPTKQSTRGQRARPRTTPDAITRGYANTEAVTV